MGDDLEHMLQRARLIHERLVNSCPANSHDANAHEAKPDAHPALIVGAEHDVVHVVRESNHDD